MADPPLGLGFTAYNQYLFGPYSIAVIAAVRFCISPWPWLFLSPFIVTDSCSPFSYFVIPFAIGSGRFQLKGYCTIMCICNLLYAGATAISWGVPLSAGSAKPNSDESSAFCSSVAWFFVVNILFQIGGAIYNVSSIAAIVSWFGGKRSKWIPAALAAREIMNQLGNLASNEIFDLDVFKLANGNFAPIL